MARCVRPLLVVLVLLVSTMSAASVAQTAADGPAIDVGVNGKTVVDGERVVVPEANLTVSVSGDVDLSTVVVRVNGEDVASYSPQGTTFDRTLDPELRARANDVQIIATDDNDVTSSFQTTVYRDTVPPAIGVSSPFDVEPGYVFPRNVTDAEPNVSLEGTVTDASNVTSFEAYIAGDGMVRTTDLDEDGSFSLNTTLGLGNATLQIKAADEYGNERRVRTRLLVEDEAEPELEILGWPENGTTSDTVTARVRATDDVGVESLTVVQNGRQDQVLLEPTASLFDEGRDVVVRNVTLRLPHEGVHNVTFNATDMANNSVEVERSVEYDPVTPEEAAVPEFVVDEQQSGYLDDETYHLNATVTNGSITNVVVESARHPTGRVLSYAVVYDGSQRETVSIDRNVTVEPGSNVVRIRATDEFGTEHDRLLRIDSRNESHHLTTASPTTEPTAEPTSTTERPPTTVAKVTAETEPPLDPVSKTSVPLSPAVSVVAMLLVAVLLSRHAERR